MPDIALAAALAGNRVLLCYGLLGEVMARLRPVGMDYMGAQADWLRSLGLPVAVVALPTAAPVAANAARIAAELTADPRPALVVGHSKGGLEALAALLHPGAAAQCRGFIALQSPFFGSPVADAVCGNRPLHRAADQALRQLGLGDGEGVRDLTTTSRRAWMAEHAAAIAALTASLPVVSAGTVLERAEHWHDQVYALTERWMRQQGAGPNDGLVPLDSALLPGAQQVVRRGGHRALVGGGQDRDPVAALRELLALVIRPSPQPAPVPHPPGR